MRGGASVPEVPALKSASAKATVRTSGLSGTTALRSTWPLPSLTRSVNAA
jgi:hypothetical protein